eukprot:TRINITY_DN17764_c0_g1_i2.p1 TRINITY_DN17764_c0_g1~~TRINITY_DN17764_c0_g1_i2.p1  ORF type:complete len:1556 (+),score=272.74 TRINITY_DN17764_c0_g1_i2:601-4668(+)
MDADGDGSIDVEEFANWVTGDSTSFCEAIRERRWSDVDTFPVRELPQRVRDAPLCPKDKLMPITLRPGAIGFDIGGARGNMVIRVTCSQVVRKGWKLVTYGQLTEPTAILKALKKNLQRKRCTVTFEVDELTARKTRQTRLKHLWETQHLRATRLREIMAQLGVNDLYELEDLKEEDRALMLQNIELQSAMISKGALFEAEVLTQRVTADVALNTIAAHHCLKQNDIEGVKLFMGHCDPELRDEIGNTLLHCCSSAESVNLLLPLSSSVLTWTNLAGCTPLHEALKNCDVGSELEVLNEFGIDANPEQMFEMDSTGISPVMRLSGRGQHASVETMCPCWDDLTVALQSSTQDLLPALRACHESWPSIMEFHCFGELSVWKDGKHTEQSMERLRFIWSVMARLFEEFRKQDHCAEEPLRKLLAATKGPQHKLLDPRAPYRQQLIDTLRRLDEENGAVLRAAYEDLTSQGVAADWLQRLPEGFSPGLQEDAIRMDFHHLAPDVHGIVPPKWLVSQSFSMTDIQNDLRSIGMVGTVSAKDELYDLFVLAGMGQSNLLDEEILRQSLMLSRFFCAWLRGVNQHLQGALARCLTEKLGKFVDSGQLTFRSEAKSFSRMLEKLNKFAMDICKRSHQSAEDCSQALRQAAGLITDINGATAVFASASQLHNAYEHMLACHREGSMCLLRTGNGFEKTWLPPLPHYRDMKLMVACKLPDEMPGVPKDAMTLLELQLHLAKFYGRKAWMHLPFEVGRGSFDWSHIQELIQELIQQQLMHSSQEDSEKVKLSKEANSPEDAAPQDASLEDELLAELERAMGGNSFRMLKTALGSIQRSGFLSEATRRHAADAKPKVATADFQCFITNGDVQHYDAIHREAFDLADENVKRRAIRLYGHISAAIDKLQEAIATEDATLLDGAVRMAKATFKKAHWDLVNQAEVMLQELTDVDLVELTKRCMHEDEQVRERSINTLRRIPVLGERVSSELEKTREHDDRVALLHGIGVAGNLDACEALLKAHQDPDHEIQCVAGASLRQIMNRSLRDTSDSSALGRFSKVVVEMANEIRSLTDSEHLEPASLSHIGVFVSVFAEEGSNLSHMDTGFASVAEAVKSFIQARRYSWSNVLKEACFSANCLRMFGVSTAELREAGYSAEELEMGKGIGSLEISAAKIKSMGFPLESMKVQGFSATEMVRLGFTAAEMRAAGFSAQDVKNAGFTAQEMKTAGFKASEMAFICTPQEIRSLGFKAEEMKTEGFTARKMKTAGFTAKEMKAAGFKVEEMTAVGFSAFELRNGGFTAFELRNGGFTALQLIDGGFTDLALRDGGFRAREIECAREWHEKRRILTREEIEELYPNTFGEQQREAP